MGGGGGAERFPNERLLEEWEEDHCVGPAEPRLYFTGRVFQRALALRAPSSGPLLLDMYVCALSPSPFGVDN